MMKHYQTTSIGVHRGSPRLWLQGENLAHAGFSPGKRFDLFIEEGKLRLVLDDDGKRTVSSKIRGGRAFPVIDINSRGDLLPVSQYGSVRILYIGRAILVTPMASEVRRLQRLERTSAKMQAGDALELGSLSHGGGILTHAVHTGLYQEGIDARLRFANEIRGELLDHARAVNESWESDTVALAAPLQELAFDTEAMACLPPVDILEAGLPCSGASVSGRSKRKLALPEDHPEVGHLVVPFMTMVSQVNPLVVILENVVPYRSSASASIIRSLMRDFGYETHECILSGREFGAVEDRDRYCLLAVTRGVEIDLERLTRPEVRPATLGDVLEPVASDDPRWSTMSGLKAKMERDVEAGKGFRMQVFDASSTRIGTITKGYAKVRSTDPKIRHPENPDLLRQLMPIEHARVKQIPEHLVDGLSDTTAHEVLGQSVVYQPFVAIGVLIARALKEWCAKLESLTVSGAGALSRSVCG